jgi:RNA polymerase sigma-70 factor (ECF subfamily)
VNASATATRPPPSDKDLWAAVRAGDEAAFELFYIRHRPVAVQIARRICGEAAEDAVQAAFLSIWRSRASYSAGRGSARAWLMTTVRNRAIDVARANKTRREVAAGERLPDVEDPVRTEEVALGRATSDVLRTAISQLPARQRQVVELGYIAELSQSEIARTLGLPLGTVKGRSRLALKRLAAVAV